MTQDQHNTYHKCLLTIALLLLGILPCTAQQVSVQGTVVDGETGRPLSRATLQLFRPGKKDTTFVAGALSDSRGAFSFKDMASGSYLLKASFLGYQPLTQPVTVSARRATSVGRLSLKSEAVQLKEAVVTAQLPKMVVKDDTVVYNADAFSVPEGAVIEALVEALPGAKIDDDGKITINGKDVKRFKLDGRDFMTGNNEAVMKNLPSYVIDKVKAYDE